MTFGAMFTLFRGVETSLKQAIAAEYGVADRVLDSWLATFNQVRNRPKSPPGFIAAYVSGEPASTEIVSKSRPAFSSRSRKASSTCCRFVETYVALRASCA